MDWWIVAKPYVEAPMAVIAFALGIGNTAWLVKKARKVKTEEESHAAIEAELERMVDTFVQSPMQIHSIPHGNDLEMAAAVLGLSRGVLRGFWDDGSLHVILAAIDADAKKLAKWMLNHSREDDEAHLQKVLELVAQHGTVFFEVPPELYGGAYLAFRRGLVQWRIENGVVYISGLSANR